MISCRNTTSLLNYPVNSSRRPLHHNSRSTGLLKVATLILSEIMYFLSSLLQYFNLGCQLHLKSKQVQSHSTCEHTHTLSRMRQSASIQSRSTKRQCYKSLSQSTKFQTFYVYFYFQNFFSDDWQVAELIQKIISTGKKLEFSYKTAGSNFGRQNYAYLTRIKQSHKNLQQNSLYAFSVSKK